VTTSARSSQRLTSKRLRGYRIHVFRGASSQPPSYTTPLLWRESVPLEEWQAVIADPRTQHAWIIRSGRKMRQFEFRRSDSLSASAS
jgi:hypothetical protein